nr:hypothetical protein [Tanacetum cinerariifolium]
MSKDPSIPRRNKVNWHYVRDDHMCTTIKLVSRHQNTQQFGALLPIELTNEDIRNSRSSSDITITPLTPTAGPRLTTFEKGKQAAKASKAKSLSAISKKSLGIPLMKKVMIKMMMKVMMMMKDKMMMMHKIMMIRKMKGMMRMMKTKDEESFDPILKTPENTDDEGNGEENLGMNVGREEGQDEEDEADELYRDININLGRGIQLGDTTLQMDVQIPTSVALLPVSAPILTPSTIATITTTLQAPTTPTIAPSALLQDLPNFGSLFGFDHRLKTLEANFSEFMQTNQFAGASDRLRDEAPAKNDEFLKTIDENMQKIIKEQVKEQVKTSYVVAADLSKMELKKILIEKMEGNKSIHRSNEQRNLYKALVEGYESDKIILDIEGKEPESASAPQEKATRIEEPMQTTFEVEEPSHLEFEIGADDQLILEPSQHPEWFSQQKKPPTPDRDWNNTLPATHRSIQPGHTEVYKATTDQLDWVNPEGQQYPHNLLKPLPLIPNSRGRHVIPFDHFINNDLEYLRGAGSESRPPMLNKENYVSWSSRLLRYAKSRPNGKLIHNSIINGPYVRRIFPEPGDTNREVPVNGTFHVQIDDELTQKELKQIENDD